MYPYHIPSSLWLPSTDSSISSWTNSPPKMMSCHVFLTGTKFSIITSSNAFSHEAHTFCCSSWWETVFESPTYQSSLNYILYSVRILPRFSVSYNATKIPRSRYFLVLPMLSVFLYFRLIESCSALSFYTNLVDALSPHPEPHSNHFIFLSIFQLFILVSEDNFLLKLDLLNLLYI